MSYPLDRAFGKQPAETRAEAERQDHIWRISGGTRLRDLMLLLKREVAQT
jgi:hypothetical protein